MNLTEISQQLIRYCTTIDEEVAIRKLLTKQPRVPALHTFGLVNSEVYAQFDDIFANTKAIKVRSDKRSLSTADISPLIDTFGSALTAAFIISDKVSWEASKDNSLAKAVIEEVLTSVGIASQLPAVLKQHNIIFSIREANVQKNAKSLVQVEPSLQTNDDSVYLFHLDASQTRPLVLSGVLPLNTSFMSKHLYRAPSAALIACFPILRQLSICNGEVDNAGVVTANLRTLIPVVSGSKDAGTFMVAADLGIAVGRPSGSSTTSRANPNGWMDAHKKVFLNIPAIYALDYNIELSKMMEAEAIAKSTSTGEDIEKAKAEPHKNIWSVLSTQQITLKTIEWVFNMVSIMKKEEIPQDFCEKITKMLEDAAKLELSPDDMVKCNNLVALFKSFMSPSF